MRSILFCMLMCVSGYLFAQNQNVGIGTAAPNASAALDVTSTNKGMLVPRMTTGQRTGISSPAKGLLVFDNNTATFWYFDGSQWVNLVAASSSSSNELIDNDGDTKVEVEKTADDDIIRFTTSGTEMGKMDGQTFHLQSPGSSLFIGTNAGQFDDGTSNFCTGIGVGALSANTNGLRLTAVGFRSLLYNTTGDNNTAVGGLALFLNTTGDFNTANGALSMQKNTTGSNNSAFGFSSLFNNTIGRNNVALGNSTLRLNTTGNDNVASGFNALFSNTTGYSNAGFGAYALRLNVVGNNNTAVGTRALEHNTDGDNSTAAGYEALTLSTTGIQNSAYGANSLKKNTTGNDNNAFGFQSLGLNVSGAANTAMGNYALYNTKTGKLNVGFGRSAIYYNITGENNTAIGSFAFNSSPTDTAIVNSTAVGYNSLINTDNTIRLGNAAVTTIGGFANWTNVSDGRFKRQVQENVKGLEFINLLRPVTYQLDMDAIATFYDTPSELRLEEQELLKSKEVQSGFIAQEVETAALSAGYDFHGVEKPVHDRAHYGLRYAEFVVPLVKAVQEQQVIIKTQEAELDLIKERLARLEGLLDR